MSQACLYLQGIIQFGKLKLPQPFSRILEQKSIYLDTSSLGCRSAGVNDNSKPRFFQGL